MDLYSYMFEYIPLNKGNDYDSQTLVYLKSGNIYSEERKKLFCDRIKEWLKQALKNVGGAAYILVALAPGHKAGSSSGFLSEVIAEVVSSNPLLKDGLSLLRRTQDVQKATEGGPRDVDLHKATIKVTNPESVAGKVVCIIDDVWTTGATLNACGSLIVNAKASDVNAKASEVKLLAVGKTK